MATIFANIFAEAFSKTFANFRNKSGQFSSVGEDIEMRIRQIVLEGKKSIGLCYRVRSVKITKKLIASV